MAAPLLLTTAPVYLIYTTTTLFQLYHGGDMMQEMRRRKPEPSLLPNKRNFNPHHRRTGTRCNDAVNYAQQRKCKLAEVVA